MKQIYIFIKRICDVIISIFALIMLSPIYVIIYFLSRIFQGKKVFYKQKRIGKKGKEFYIYKFRTMKYDAEEMISNFSKKQKEEFYRNYKLVDDPRTTKFGKVLRKTSLDELPQFWNILKGDMALIGPRPIVKEEFSQYLRKEQEKLLKLKPGLIGYWQIYTTKETTYRKRQKMELYYVENEGPFLDLKIFFKSFYIIIKRAIM